MSTSNTMVKLALGTGSWTTESSDIPKQKEFLEIARQHGITTIDTARVYGNGASESFLGQEDAGSKFEIITKSPIGVVPGAAAKAAILQNAALSLDTLQVSEVPIYLLHGPDDSVPISETLEAIQELYQAGKFKKFGLSNFNLPEVEEIYNYNKSRGYILPTVYQSIYNLVARTNEITLFPTLRRLGISIQVYSPIASGFLVKSPEDIKNGRGKWDSSNFFGKLLQALYGKPVLLQYLHEYIKLARESGNSQSALAYRWVRYNSALSGEFGDAVIIGASSPEQLKETLADLENGPLEPWITARLDELWKTIVNDAPSDNIATMKQLLAAGGV
ncbi:Aldo/keto reductase [Aspergillus cavernicola]|uniref:Aldo/keto reductase n=1 Tax=Aspergillus cavernicola TaxID=176166 RepID=A0ABR4IBI6_9EURO